MILKKFHKVLEIEGQIHKLRRRPECDRGDCISCSLSSICTSKVVTKIGTIICNIFKIKTGYNFENDSKKAS